jgi:hypothetical protein
LVRDDDGRPRRREPLKGFSDARLIELEEVIHTRRAPAIAFGQPS